MAKKEKAPLLISPKGVAAYAHIEQPDTKGQYADNKYKVTLLLDKGDATNDALAAHITQLNEKCGGDAQKCPVKDGDKDKNEDFKGKWKIIFKSQFAPKRVDAKKVPLGDNVNIWGGDVIKVAYTEYDYERGVSLRLAAVQLIEKRASGGMGAASAFDEEEGFTAEEAGADFGADTKGDNNGDF